MRLILLDGGPASGKNTLGILLTEKLHNLEEKAILLDLDQYVEEFNPNWIWLDKDKERNDQLKARENFINDISKYLKDNFTVIGIGEKFLTKNDIFTFNEKVNINCQIFLYHLSTPFSLRQKRLHERGPHSLIDLEKDQKERDAVKNWPGFVYKNINSPEVDAENLMKLIEQKKGLINF